MNATRRTPVGQVSVFWRTEGDRFTLQADLADGVPTVVVLPDGTRIETVVGHLELGCALPSGR